MLIDKTQKMKLTRSRVEAFRTEDVAQVVWDDQLPSFGVRVSPTGRKSYFLFYRIGRNGRQRSKVIGRHPLVTADQARETARQWLIQAWDGNDPNAPNVRDDSNPTVSDFADRYIEEHCKLRKKSGPTKTDQLFVRRFIKPKIGKLRVREVTRFDIARLHTSMSSTPVQANAVRALLSHMFNKAEEWGLRPDGTNPVRHVKKFTTKPRERYLTQDELKRLAREISRIHLSNPVVANFVRLVLLTGCRRNEIMTLKFEYIDFEAKCLRLPDSKTGAKTVPVADVALDLLREIQPLPGNPYVFPGKLEGQHITTVKTAWNTIRKRSGMPDLRIHDLRHHFGTEAGRQNVPLRKISGILGHKSQAITERYSHHVPEDLIDAANKTASAIANLLH